MVHTSRLGEQECKCEAAECSFVFPGEFPGRPPSVSTLTSTSSSITSSIPESESKHQYLLNCSTVMRENGCVYLDHVAYRIIYDSWVTLSLPSGPYEEMKLTINTPMDTIVRTMAAPDSGLEIRDRMWLKITIPNAFIGELGKKNWRKHYNAASCVLLTLYIVKKFRFTCLTN